MSGSARQSGAGGVGRPALQCSETQNSSLCTQCGRGSWRISWRQERIRAAQVLAKGKIAQPPWNCGDGSGSSCDTLHRVLVRLTCLTFSHCRNGRLRLRQARIESELPEGAPSQLAGDAQLRLRTRCVQARSWAPPGALSMGRGYAAKETVCCRESNPPLPAIPPHPCMC